MTGWTDSDGSGSTSRYEREPGETPAGAVIRGVAAVLERSPLEMDPLHEAVDPDALNSLFDGSGDPSDSVRVSFEYCGLAVTMDVDGIRLVDSDPATR